MVFLGIHNFVDNTQFWEDCADQDKGIISEHFDPETLEIDQSSNIFLRNFFIPNSDIDQGILSKTSNEGESEFITIFLFFLRSTDRDDLENCCNIIVE